MKLINIGNGCVGVLGVEVVAAVNSGAEDHERSVLGLILVFEFSGAEVDAGATLQRGEECGGDVGAHPVGDPIQLIARHEAAGLVHRFD